MTGTTRPPIGMELHRTAKRIAQAFDHALSEAGGTLPVWLTLLTVKSQKRANQRELAARIGIRGATLTHHLNAMEAEGLVTRRRDPSNRRVHKVELTEAGEAMFSRLRVAAVAFDTKLRGKLPDDRIEELAQMLATLRANVSDQD